MSRKEGWEAFYRQAAGASQPERFVCDGRTSNMCRGTWSLVNEIDQEGSQETGTRSPPARRSSSCPS